MKRPNLALVLAAALLTPACKSGAEQVTSARLGVGIIDSYEATQSIAGLSGTDDVDDYSNVVFDLGVTSMNEDGQPASRASIEVGQSNFVGAGLDIDATEIAIGGRVYGTVVGSSGALPFATAQALFSIGDAQGVDIGTQVGARIGGGIQYGVSDRAFVDIIADYTIPFAGAQLEVGGVGTLETEFSGFAIRIGLGYNF